MTENHGAVVGPVGENDPSSVRIDAGCTATFHACWSAEAADGGVALEGSAPCAGQPTAAAAQLPDFINLGPDQILKVRSIAELTADKAPRITIITDSQATLLFNSTTPLVCAIVYSKTTAYGKIATDQDMAGGGHTDHHPFIANLEADTESH